MAKALEALGNTVILEVKNNKETKTESGIILTPKSDQESKSQATVISVGQDVKNIKIGDTVVISSIGGEVFYLDGRTFYALKDTDIFCVIRETN